MKFTKIKRQDDGTILATDLVIPFFGYKFHISIDRKFRLIRKWKATDAAASDGARLREGLLDKTNTASIVWAGSKANEDFMDKQGFVSKVYRKKPHLKSMSRHIQRSNAGQPIIRSCVEYVFADQKSQTGLFVRTMGITRATMRIGLTNITLCERRSAKIRHKNYQSTREKHEITRTRHQTTVLRSFQMILLYQIL